MSGSALRADLVVAIVWQGRDPHRIFRSPDLSHHRPFTEAEGAKIVVKVDHLQVRAKSTFSKTFLA